MKGLVTAAVTVLVVAPSAYSVGVATDPRVPALQNRVTHLEIRMDRVRPCVASLADAYYNPGRQLDYRCSIVGR